MTAGIKRYKQIEKDLTTNNSITTADAIFYICYCQAFNKKCLLK